MSVPSRIPAGGFTIVELVVTLVVVGVIVALALPKSSNDPLLLSAQVTQLEGDIRYVQTLSMTQGQSYRINFSAAGYTITLADAGGTPAPQPLSGSTGTTSWNPGVTYSQTNLGSNLLAFDGLGVPYTDSLATSSPLAVGTNYQITLGKNGQSQVITITPQTGRLTP